jgi:ActR/RegA family two-component response regulator
MMTRKQIILLATQRFAELNAFTQALEADGQVMVICVTNARQALDTAIQVVPALAVIDEKIGPDDGLALVRQLLQVNAFIYTVVLTDMEEALFHERSEGLGIMMRLSLKPDGDDAQKMFSMLRALLPTET